MTITLYQTSSENNVVDKTITGGIVLTGTLRQETSVLSPSIRIVTNTNISGYNYAYISEFGRFYYIKEIVTVRSGVWDVGFRCDVLMTYKTQIRGLTAVVERQENQYNAYVNDPEFILMNKKRIQTKEFPYGFSQLQHYIIAISGGYEYNPPQSST